MRKLTSLLLAGTIVTGSQIAGQAKEMQISTWVPPSHSINKQLEEWGDEIEAETDGSLEVNIYPSSQLGAAPDHYDMARDGIAEMALVGPSYNAGRFPLWALNEIPFQFSNTTTGARAFHEWYAEYAEVEMPDVHLCFVTVHHPGALNFAKSGVHVPEDMKGLRMRPGGPTMAEWMTSLGANTVSAALPEVKELADRGVIDGVMLPWDMVLFGIHEAMPYHIDEPFYVGSQAYLINKSFYDGLSETERAAIDGHCGPDTSEKFSTVWYEEQRKFRQQLIDDPEQEVYQLTPDERQLWMATAEPVAEKAYEDVSDKWDIDGAEAGQKLKEKLKEHGALVE